jgi:type VI secretion system protein ImpC
MATNESALLQQETVTAAMAAEPHLLDKIIKNSRLGEDEDEREKSRSWVQAFLEEVFSDKIRISKDLDSMLSQRIAEIDGLLSDQVNEIMHLPRFQALEATWRGLNYLTQQTETSPTLKIKVMNARKKDVLNDLRLATEFDQSNLFKKVYEEEYGTLGGHPFGILLGDYEFGRSSEDMEVLEKICGVAAAAHTPFLAAATPGMFGWDSFTQLTSNRDLSKIFDNTLYVRWKMFREREDSRYVGLALPHILLREPYGSDTITVESFQYEEKVDGTDHSKYLWGNAAYALAARITDSFSRHQWCLAIRGVEGGGLVEDLPVHTFETEDGGVNLKCPTELAIPDRREKEFADLGFIPLCHEKRSNRAVFFGAQSCQKPRSYYGDNATANASLSAQLPYILAVSRFAHYLKAIARDKIGTFQSRASFEKFLNDWIANYVLLDDTATQDAKAKYPLREARVEVKDVPGKPGSYTAIAYLRPHFQLDALTASLRLVAELPARKQ